MKAKTLERRIAVLSTLSSSDLVSRFQSLREVGLLPTDRGKHAADITAAQCAHALLGLASDRAGESGPGAIIFATYRPVQKGGKAFLNCKTLFETVEALLSNPKVALVCRLEICPGHSWARLQYTVSGLPECTIYMDPLHSRFDEMKDMKPEAFAQGVAYRAMCFGGGFLGQIALYLSKTDDGSTGYAGSTI
jgi:hypothetical protein